MESKVKLLTGNYADVCFQLGRLPNDIGAYARDILKPAAYNKVEEEIRVDLHRTPFWGSKEQAKDFLSDAHTKHTLHYTQGDFYSRSLSLLFQLLSEKTRAHCLYNCDEDHHQQAKKKTGFAYFSRATKKKALPENDETNRQPIQKNTEHGNAKEKEILAGCNLFTLQNHPEVWLFTFIQPTTTPISDRTVHIYISSALFDLSKDNGIEQLNMRDCDFHKSISEHIDQEAILNWAQLCISRDTHTVNENVEKGIFCKEEQKLIIPQCLGNEYAVSKPEQQEKLPVSLDKLIKEMRPLFDNIKPSNTQQKRHKNDFAQKIQRLNVLCDEFCALEPAEQEQKKVPFQKHCSDIIIAARNDLPYEKWDRFIINSGLLLLSLIALYLVAATCQYLLTGNFLLYNPDNEQTEALQPLHRAVISL